MTDEELADLCVVCDCAIGEAPACHYLPNVIETEGGIRATVNCHGQHCPRRRVKILPDGRLVMHSRLFALEELENG